MSFLPVEETHGSRYGNHTYTNMADIQQAGEAFGCNMLWLGARDFSYNHNFGYMYNLLRLPNALHVSAWRSLYVVLN